MTNYFGLIRLNTAILIQWIDEERANAKLDVPGDTSIVQDDIMVVLISKLMNVQ